MTAHTRTTELGVIGMTCASCAAHVSRALKSVPGVEDAAVNLPAERATIVHDPSVQPAALVAAIEHAGYEARTETGDNDTTQRNAEELRRKRLILTGAIVLSAATIVLSMAVPEFTGKAWVLFALTLPVWAIAGWEFHGGAIASLRSRTATMDTLVSLGSTAAMALSIYEALRGLPTYFETASVIVTLVYVGRYLEAAARVRSGAAMRSLLDLRPAQARRVVPGGSETIAAELVQTGDVLIVAAGERIPVDGEIVEGTSFIDRSMLTGESMPVSVERGSHVEAGTINGDGTLRVRATAVGAGTELARIIEIVRRAQGSMPPVQRLADRVAGVFVPTIIAIAIVTFAGWLLTQHPWSVALIAAVAVLVVACPCALGLATPSAIIAGVGAAARKGILFKDASAMERAATIGTVVFDKTGTLTRGTPAVTAVHTFDGVANAEVLALAASIEHESTHPLASAILRAANDAGATLADVTDVAVTRGAGITGTVDGRRIAVGNAAYTHASAADGSAATRVFVARDGDVLGSIDIADEPRASAREAIASLTAFGIRTSLMSGDAPGPVEAVAAACGITDWRAGVSPEEKAQIVQSLRDDGTTVAFVGDGINDAPALATADVGFAMGGGTAVALETAQAAILSEDPRAVVTAVRYARATMQTIRQNLFWAFIYNIVLIPLAAFGVVNPMFAAGAMGLSSLFVVGNSLRLARR